MIIVETSPHIEVYHFAADNRPSPDCRNDMLPTNRKQAHITFPKIYYLALNFLSSLKTAA